MIDNYCEILLNGNKELDSFTSGVMAVKSRVMHEIDKLPITMTRRQANEQFEYLTNLLHFYKDKSESPLRTEKIIEIAENLVELVKVIDKLPKVEN